MTSGGKKEALLLGCGALEEMESLFNMVLTDTLRKMEKKGADEGTITLKLDVALVTERVADRESGEISTARNPAFKWACSSAISIKDSYKGESYDPDAALVFDPDTKRYMIVLSRDQISLDDLEVQNVKM